MLWSNTTTIVITYICVVFSRKKNLPVCPMVQLLSRFFVGIQYRTHLFLRPHNQIATKYSLSFFYIMICWNIYKLFFSFLFTIYDFHLIFRRRLWPNCDRSINTNYSRRFQYKTKFRYDMLYKFESTNIYGTKQ